MSELRFRVGAGIVSAGLALGAAEVVAVIVGADTAPIQVLGSTVVDHTPDDVREWAIQTFGTADKTVLYLCMGVVAVVFAGFVGALERTTRAAGSALLAAFGILTAILAAQRNGVAGALPTVLGVGVGIYALRVLTGRIDELAARRRRDERETAPASTGSAPDAEEPVAGVETAASKPDTEPPASTTPSTGAEQPDSNSRLPISTSRPVHSTASASVPRPHSAARGAGSADIVHAPDEGGTRSPVATSGRGSDVDDSPTRTATPDPDRRKVLRGLAITGGLAVLTGAGGRWIGSRRADVSAERAAVQLPVPSGPPISLPPEADLRVPGLTPYLTPSADFYRIDTALIVPQVSIEDWSLRIHGMVDREIVLRWDDLANREAVERLVTLACVSNPIGGELIGNALWRGYRIDQLLAEAGPRPDADMVLSTSKDGWTAGTPLAVLTDGRDALLAIGMNGEPLPVSHGYPARLVVPGLYGYVSATKWVTELEVTRFDRATAYWTRRGWSAYGPIKTGTRIDTPNGRGRVERGKVAVAGVAWAQHRGISAVEVQIDNGPWERARLSADQSVDTWRQWVYDWNATSGQHTVRARAVDGSGAVQTADYSGVLPDGATGYPVISVRVT
ncbi:molybdopterin-dependent oxidoreductase [Nocardia bovistercoris]|uniref:Molybdopterin-dependent oxidoreductase n=1 Tax=Nocardia bovistercoris TaxID=2785916 RepID=A0A931I8U8_9NOCA|nr:molybdopterin-dependent oxidoreductase [Nocardia bovistercoris]MBH0775862.1 molybdopterin-dependent oxidoreductase [Nocardia bovistercoris]